MRRHACEIPERLVDVCPVEASHCARVFEYEHVLVGREEHAAVRSAPLAADAADVQRAVPRARPFALERARPRRVGGRDAVGEDVRRHRRAADDMKQHARPVVACEQLATEPRERRELHSAPLVRELRGERHLVEPRHAEASALAPAERAAPQRRMPLGGRGVVRGPVVIGHKHQRVAPLALRGVELGLLRHRRRRERVHGKQRVRVAHHRRRRDREHLHVIVGPSREASRCNRDDDKEKEPRA
mmetsp:Transcript_20727/g.43749  ORF Transcript_20727/g.43749 Transcript_20727/m.43749 type:complete len:244 (-) Transcript_20727:450-1181(-)